MLTLGEAAGLSDQRLPPKLRQVIGSIGGNRPVILARATPASYTGVAGGQQTVISLTIPASTLIPGDMLRFSIGGLFKNTGAINDFVGAQVKLTQGFTSSFYGLPAQTAPSANFIAWRSEGLFVFSVPGAGAQFLPAMSASQPTGVPRASQLVNEALVFTGYADTLVSSPDASAANNRGGLLQNAAAGAGSILTATANQASIENTQPMLIEIIVGDCAGTNVLTVTSGVLEGL